MNVPPLVPVRPPGPETLAHGHPLLLLPARHLERPRLGHAGRVSVEAARPGGLLRRVLLRAGRAAHRAAALRPHARVGVDQHVHVGGLVHDLHAAEGGVPGDQPQAREAREVPTRARVHGDQVSAFLLFFTKRV